MNNKSLWQDVKINVTNKKKISSNIDILIIGGGITGLTLAYLLKDTDQSIMIIDKSKLGEGITCKTTAKINYLQDIIYQTLTKKHDKKTAHEYLNSQLDAINIIKDIINKNNIKCDLERVDSIIFTLEEKGINKILKEKELLEEFNIKVEEVQDKNIKSGIKVKDTYVFHPLKYLQGLTNIIKKTQEIHEGVTAYSIDKIGEHYEVKTSSGIISASHVVIACNYPFYIIPSLIPLKTYVKREYVNVAKCDNPKSITAISIDSKLHSIRYYQNYIIYGSNASRITDKTDYAKEYRKSQKDFQKIFKQPPLYTWMNQDLMSNDSLPFIGSIHDHLYLASTYQAWGMTNGTIAAQIISDLITNNYNRYTKLFDPKRLNISLITESCLGSFRYLKAYISAFFYKNNPYYIKINGMIYGYYKDSDDYIHRIKLVCPHMKCNLVFNEIEGTWDCPCHGSRFNTSGKVLVGPSTKDLENIIVKK